MSVRAAFLFPGQGAKRADAALRAAVRAEPGRALCELAARAAGVALAEVLRRPSLLERTDVYQPMITALALAAAQALGAAGIAPAVVLGHSLGEVAAWAAAGGLPAEAAIELAALRGRLMAREAALHPGGMVALASADEAVIEAALAAGRRAGALVLAARNAPDETVLSGDEAAVRAVMAFAPDIATRVPTAGAWHSPAMAGALAEWRAAVRAAAAAGALRCAVVANRTGEVAAAEEIPELLADQLVRPVAWVRALATVAELADVIVTLGPGAVLRSLWHRNQRASADGGRASGERGGLSGAAEVDASGRLGAQGAARADARAHGAGEAAAVGGGGAGRWFEGGRGRDLPPTQKRMFATEDERSLAEAIAVLRAEQGISTSLVAP